MKRYINVRLAKYMAGYSSFSCLLILQYLMLGTCWFNLHLNFQISSVFLIWPVV